MKIFITLALLVSALRGFAVSPSPYTEGVIVSLRATMSYTNSGSNTTAFNGSANFSIVGEGATAASTVYFNAGEATPAVAWLKPGKKYSGTWGGVGGGPPNGYSSIQFAADVSFIAPQGYTLYLNDLPTDPSHFAVPTDTTHFLYTSSSNPANPAGSITYSAPVTLELRPNGNAQALPAGVFSGISIGKAISWEVGLGSLRSGNSAGTITFREPDLSNNPGSRDRLYYVAPSNAGQIAVTNDTGTERLQKIVTPQAIVDLADEGNGYRIKFSDPGSPTTTWRSILVQYVSPDLTITEYDAGSVSSVSKLSLAVVTGNNVWTIQEGDGATVLRTAVHTNSVPASGQRDDNVVIYTGEPTGTSVQKTKYHYEVQNAVAGWGEELVEVAADPDTANLKTTYAYHTTSTAAGNYLRVKSITYPSGGWVSYAYHDDWDKRGQLSLETRPFVDTPAAVASLSVGNSVSHSYTADYSGRYRIESATVAKTTDIQSGGTTTTTTLGLVRGINGTDIKYTSYQTTASASASYGQQTTSEIIDSNQAGDFAGQPLSVKRPDQSQDSYAYYYGTYSGTTFTASITGTYFRTIVWHGSVNSSGADSFTSYDNATLTTIYLVPNKSTMDVTIRNPAGLIVRQETQIYIGNVAPSFSLVTYQNFTYDVAGRLTDVVSSNGATIHHEYTAGHLTKTVDVTGTETDFTYDALGRVASSTKKGAAATTDYAVQGDVTTKNTYDGANNITQTESTDGTSTPLTITSTATYDMAGRITQQVQYSGSTNALTTGYAYDVAARSVTVTLPGGGTKITKSYLDGSLKSITGTGVVAEFMVYSMDTDSGNRITQHRLAADDSDALTTTTNDWLGRNISVVRPGWDGGTITKTCSYSSFGQLTKCSQTGLANTLYTYDTLGGLVNQGLDIDADGALVAASSDRFTTRDWTFFSVDDNWWRRDTTTTYATAATATATQTEKIETQLSGLPANRLSLAKSYDIYGNVTTAYTDVARTDKIVTNTTVAPDSTTNAVQIAYNGLLMSAQDTTGVVMKYGYDTLGRMFRFIDPRTAGTGTVPLATTTAFLAGTNLVASVTDPAGVAQSSYTYDSAGRVTKVTQPEVGSAYYEYTTIGQKLHEWGDTIHPIEYVYDTYGRQTRLKTFASSTATFTTATWPTTGLGSPAFTFWDYETASGLLKSKYDAANLNASGQPIANAKKVSYTYTSAGQPATRTAQRGVVATYTYSSTTGELSGISYSDSTPSVTYIYNRLGSVATVTDATGTTTLNYNLTGTLELQSEDLPAYFSSRRLTSTYDTTTGVAGRTIGLQLGSSASPAADQSVGYAYQVDGRLSTITGGGQTFTYGYVANSNLIGTVANTALNYADTRTYNPTHDWTKSRETTWGASPAISKAKFVYTQDTIGRTTAVIKTGELFNRYGNGVDGLTTSYGYDAISQLKSEQTTTTIGTTSTILAGRDNGTSSSPGFTYDHLGNRTATTHNGADIAHTSSYTTNVLNQYTDRTVPGIFDVAGGTVPGTTVTVNGSALDVVSQGGYFFKGQAMTNTSSAAYTTLTVSDGVTHISGSVPDVDLGVVGTEWKIVGTGDFNGDGNPDILWQNVSTSERFIWLMDGAAHTGGVSLGFVDTAWSIAAAADFNGDGQTDILWQNTSTGERFIWAMNGTSHTGGATLGVVSTDWSIATAADFNGDGQNDILWQNTGTGERYIWFMSGPYHLGDVSLGLMDTEWSIAASGDFNGDGKADILWQDSSTGERFVWFMSGTDHVGGVSLGVVSTTSSIASAADFNSDSHPDILWQNTSTGDRYVWFMTGSTAQVPAFVPQTPEPFSYDDDGNLTSDGRWNYTYDAEDRLVAQETKDIAVTAGVIRQKLTFVYDYLGRRVSKVVQSGWDAGSSTYTTTDFSRRYIYQGWNLIAELDGSTLALVKSYYWGLDLSGTEQGAGGVGGLLLTQEGTNSYLAVYDAMGNLHGLLKASDGSIAAAYEYDAFGNTLRESGPYADSNPFRYSTKFTDIETNLIYYGQRYYSPSMGRFINKDPIEESGGLNLYGFCGNNGVNGYDLLGMDPLTTRPGFYQMGGKEPMYFTDSYWGEILAEQNSHGQGYQGSFGGGFLDSSFKEDPNLYNDEFASKEEERYQQQLASDKANQSPAPKNTPAPNSTAGNAPSNGGQSKTYIGPDGKTYTVTNDLSLAPADSTLVGWGKNYGSFSFSDGSVVRGGSNAGMVGVQNGVLGSIGANNTWSRGGTLIMTGYEHVIFDQNHTFTIAINLDTGGTEQFIGRGGPKSETEPHFHESLLSPWGPILGRTRSWREDATLFDNPSETIGTQFVGAISTDFSTVKNQMINFADAVNRHPTLYWPWPVGANSNSYNYTQIKYLGFTPPTPLLPAPGWGVNIAH